MLKHDYIACLIKTSTYSFYFSTVGILCLLSVCTVAIVYTKKHLFYILLASMSIISTKPEISSIQPDSTHRTALVGGGYIIAHFSSNDLAPYIIDDSAKHMTLASQFRFVEHVHQSSLSSRSKQSAEVFCKMPLNILVSQLPIKIQKNIAQQHGIYIPARTTKANRVQRTLL